MKEIHCEMCNKYLGYIESGSKIRKGTVHLCESCIYNLTVSQYKKTTHTKTDEMFSDFGNLFGDLFKQRK